MRQTSDMNDSMTDVTDTDMNDMTDDRIVTSMTNRHDKFDIIVT